MMGTKSRRQFSAQLKLAAVLALLAGHTSAAQICRERHIPDNLLFRWTQTFVEHAPRVFGATCASTSAAETRIADLERRVSQLTLENEISKKGGRTFNLTAEQTRAMIDLLRPHYSVTLLCRVLEYPRRSLSDVPVPSDDTALCTAIEQIMIRWPFYGYRRVTALNRSPTVNAHPQQQPPTGIGHVAKAVNVVEDDAKD